MADDTTIEVTPVSSDNEQKVNVSIDPRTKGTTANPDGDEADIDGNVKWETIEGDATVELTGENSDKAAKLVSASPNTVNRIRATVDADTGEGVAPISHDFIYTVTKAGASKIGASVGAVEQK